MTCVRGPVARIRCREAARSAPRARRSTADQRVSHRRQRRAARIVIGGLSGGLSVPAPARALLRGEAEVSVIATHAFQEHTGEVRLRLDAPTIAELFGEAARALAELVGVPSDERPHEWRPITVSARDHEALLVAWLDELIARTELDQLRYAEVAIDELTPQHLRARIRGVPIAEWRTAVKAATLHGLRVDSGPAGASATVVLDV